MNRKELIQNMSLIQILGVKSDFEDKENRYIFTCPVCNHNKSFTLYKKGYGRCSQCDLALNSATDYYTKVLSMETEEKNNNTKETLNNTNYNSPKQSDPSLETALNIWQNKNKELFKSIQKFSNFDSCNKGSIDELNFVYRMFMDLNSLVDMPKLKNSDLNYLQERGLTFKDIVRNEYFSMPNKKLAFYIVDELKRFGVLDILKVIPGFYFDRTSNSWCFSAYSGICIPIKTADDKIVGIQIRLTDSYNSKLKYIWFSSPKESRRSANFDSEMCFGTSSGSPLGIILAEDEPRSYKAIVEGHFKALSTSLIGIDTFEMQGVNSFSINEFQYIVEELKSKNRYSEEIVVFFDSDFIINYRVVMALLNLCGNLSPIADVKIAYWDLSKGKGIDDYLANGYSIEDVKIIPYSNFIKPANALIAMLKHDENQDAEMLMNFFENLL